jgi:preprotein translocase subunit Sss1
MGWSGSVTGIGAVVFGILGLVIWLVQRLLQS